MLDRLKRSGLLRSLLSAIAALFAYGGWAFFVNVSHGVDAGIRAGVVQGSYSFALTLSTTWLMEQLFNMLQRLIGSMCLSAAVTIVLICTGLFATAFGINWLAQTPQILPTILPGFILGAVYTTVYIITLSRFRKKL